LEKLEWSRLFAPSAIEFGESADKGAHDSNNRTMSRAIPEERFLKEGRGSQHEGGLETYAPNDLSVGGTWLILQEVVFEERKVRRNLEENFTKMDENSDLKNRIRVKMNKLNLVVVGAHKTLISCTNISSECMK
jgi:hypothetical protein